MTVEVDFVVVVIAEVGLVDVLNVVAVGVVVVVVGVVVIVV